MSAAPGRVAAETERVLFIPSSRRGALLTRLRCDVRFQAAVLWFVASIGLWLSQPRIGVLDQDAYAYIVGAYSLQAGSGYRELVGEALNHWPPGYSWLLSLFSNPLAAAQLINYVSFGCAVAVTFLLARRARWTTVPAVCVALVLGAGFFKHLATNAAPDILTYAAFLTATYLFITGSAASRCTALAVYAALIPVKLIATPFTPAALLALLGTSRPRKLRQHMGLIAFGLATWGLALGGTLIFNYVSIGVLIPESHHIASMESMLSGLLLFPRSMLRDVVSFWAGSILTIEGVLLFLAILSAAVFALITVRTNASSDRFLLTFGLFVLLLSFSMSLARDFSMEARLLAYGPVVMLFGFHSLRGSQPRWVAYALAACLVSVVESVAINRFGLNDERFSVLTRDAVASGVPRQSVYTNFPKLMDVQERVATIGVESPAAIPRPQSTDVFLWFDVPWDDESTRNLRRIDRPAEGWCATWRLTGAELFERC
jgi:hypothetical protein